MVKRLSAAKVSLLIDGVERWAEVTHAHLEHTVIENNLHDLTTDHETLYWTLHVQAVQSLDPNSLWRMLWDAPDTWFDITFAPAGNERPTQEQPHFAFRARSGPRPNIGGAAQVSGSHEFETSFRGEQHATPTMISNDWEDERV